MLVLVTRTEMLPFKDEIITKITQLLPNISSIYQNINPLKTNTILGHNYNDIILFGDQYITDQIDHIKFQISPKSFYQVNPTQTQVLYKQTLDYAKISKNDIVFDLYCGVGTIGLYMANYCKHVYGVEIIHDAVDNAKKNAVLNNITNVSFYQGAAEDIMPKLYYQGNIKPDVVVLDPPRKGCDNVLITTLLQQQPKRIVYVSCNPSTLARDVSLLQQGLINTNDMKLNLKQQVKLIQQHFNPHFDPTKGYKVIEIQPVDMFPHTHHIECVALIELVENGLSE
jgi:23S rRNA (uracil1939-C5)-methyltransferase